MNGLNVKFSSEEQFQRLKEYSQKTGVPMAAVVKLALAQFLDSNTKGNEANV